MPVFFDRWRAVATAQQGRRLLRALFSPEVPTATVGAYLGWDGVNPVWGVLPTATAAATATDVSGNPGFGKAWAVFSSSTEPLLDGNNVTMTRVAAGKYTVDFLVGFSSTNYGMAWATPGTVGAAAVVIGFSATGSQLATSCDIVVLGAAGGALLDRTPCSVWFFGTT